jgi:ribonuclease HI
MGRLKLNVDGAYVVHTGATCVGIILRNNEGAVLLAACRSLNFCSLALDAELQACLMGVRLALDHSNEDLIVETDSLELVRMARNTLKDGSSLGPAVEDLKLLLAEDRIISFSKIPRSCNSVSHELARVGMVEHRSNVWIGSAPDFLVSRIGQDCNGTIIT